VLEAEKGGKVRRNPFVQDRMERIDEVLNFIRNHKPTKLSDLIGYFGLEYGLTQKTILSYLQTLEAAGKVKVDRFEDTVILVE